MMPFFRQISLLFLLFTAVNAVNKTFTLENNVKVDVPPLSEETDVNGLKRYPCYVNVKVFTRSDLSYGADNVPVYAITFEKNSTDKILGYTNTSTDSTGNACVRTLCYKDVYIQVDNGYEKLVSSENQEIRFGMNIDRRLTSVRLYNVQYFGSFLGRYGPVYTPDKLNTFCLSAPVTFYHISFFALSDVKDTLTVNNNAKDLDISESWYPYRDGEFGRLNCFMKIKVQTSLFSMNITTRSVNNQSNFWYGSFITGPKMDPKGGNQTNRAACIEVRCPYLNEFDNAEIPTKVEGTIGVPLNASCSVRNTTKAIPNLNATNLGFTLILEPNNDYGQSEGVYINFIRSLARSMCFTGNNYPQSDYDMNPDTGFAISYTCS